MIKIKAVDDENVLDVCELKTNQDDICAARERHSYCNAISIAEAKYHSELYPNAIYNNVLIGFFMYQRTENHAETGVKEVIVIIDNANENAKKLYLSFGFHSTGKIDKAGY